MAVFLIASASSSVRPRTHSVTSELDAIAEYLDGVHELLGSELAAAKVQIRCAPHALEIVPMTQRNALPIAGRLRTARSAVAARGR